MAETTSSGFPKQLHVRVGLIFAAALFVFTDFQAKNLEGVQPTDFTQRGLSTKSLPLAHETCEANPYLDALEDPLRKITDRADEWISSKDDLRKSAAATEMNQWNHNRFAAFKEMARCKKDKVSCIGGACGDDESKIVCGADHLTGGCVVYSIGGNNQWNFELGMLKNTKCEVHTFDCTGDETRFHKPDSDRLHFHHVCLGTEHEDAPKTCEGTTKCGETWTLLEIQQKLKHKQIDLFKMDIEGFEWPLLRSWPELTDPASTEIALPMQVLVEVHFKTEFEVLWAPGGGTYVDFVSAQDMVDLEEHFLRMGYVVAERDDNEHCGHCTELTLLRVSCPNHSKPESSINMS